MQNIAPAKPINFDKFNKIKNNNISSIWKSKDAEKQNNTIRKEKMGHVKYPEKYQDCSFSESDESRTKFTLRQFQQILKFYTNKTKCRQIDFFGVSNIQKQKVKLRKLNFVKFMEKSLINFCIIWITCFGLAICPQSYAQYQKQQQDQQNYVIVGKVRVVDGDTLVIGGDRIRLLGIDAPEKKQTCMGQFGVEYACGLESKAFLSNLIGNNDVLCEARKKDLYGRYVSKCSLPTLTGFLDINEYMVRQGQAVAYKKYSKEYVQAQEEALKYKKGIWQGDFQTPEEYRKQQRNK
eukprot:TRINITY_DN10492_c0_g1_i1.p1 TRINITY_DN10492_c0_g1~~TRINITY_DN10492_c0_g1_i1.p1  ORF type:complete len:314 (-),score=26.43 TRINITY_DN10492_c0_g1_i1:421-1299(-)